MPSPNKGFIFCVHAHQPIGNFDWVFDEAYEKSYKPFFEVMDKHPHVPFSAHISGCLLDWLIQHKPEFIAVLKRMADRGQVEFIGGAYYEPIYGLIPENDLKGQLDLMSQKIQSLFGQTPQGVWLTERVWDSKVIKPLSEAGVKFTILDDLHFEKAGLDAPVTGYYQTKKGKDSLDLFASMKNLRYLMPFRKAEETLEFIHTLPAGTQDVLVFADDVEKFGMWPGTYDWVYKEGWLDRFLTLIEQDSSVTIFTFGGFRKNFKPKGIVEIPHASYSEMMEWSGGWFYNFLKRYPESRYMYERMTNVSRRLEKIKVTRTNAEACREAKLSLYKAQCNCSYWHGVFGGLYLHHLRSAVFENLIRAERWMDEAQKTAKKAAAKIWAEKFDSAERVRIQQKDIAAVINPGYGASVEELDHLPKSVNVTCNLKRRKEVYHEAVLKKSTDPVAAGGHMSIHEILGVKEEGLEKHLQYDQFHKACFLDHFFEETIDREAFALCRYADAGDFASKAYKVSVRKKGAGASVSFLRKGNLVLGGKKHPFSVEKVFTPKGANVLSVKYTLKNLSARPVAVAWGTEFNFSIGDKQAMEGLDVPSCKDWIFNDSWRGLQIELGGKEEFRLLAAPIETISESESGLERTYQELGVLLERKISLKPGESVQYVLELALKS